MTPFPKELENIINILIKGPKIKITGIFDLPEFKNLSEEHKEAFLTLLFEFLSKRTNDQVDLDELNKKLNLMTETCFKLVPDLLVIKKINFAIFLACLSSLFDDVFDDKIDMPALSTGIHNLMIMHVSEGNKKAQLASNMFNDFQAIKK